MHFAHTSEILACLTESMETDLHHAAHWLDMLVFQPDPDDFDNALAEFD